MRVKQKEVPIRMRRIAAQHLESIRFSQIGLNTDDLYLGDDVCPIYRADLDTPAYYEFQVLKSTRTKVDNREDVLGDVKKVNHFDEKGFRATYITPGILEESKKLSDAKLLSNVQGFIMVSTNDHDFPIPHWSLESISPSLHIESQANSLRKKISKVFKVDALTYLGEDSNGVEIAHLGSMPAVIKGLPTDLKKFEGAISSSVSVLKSRDTRFLNDSHNLKQGRTINKGPKPKELSFTMKPWLEFKKDFKKSFKPMLEMLKSSAVEVWKTQSMIEELGEGIIAGQIFNLVPLEKEYEVEISGDAAEFVKLRILKRPEGFSVVELTTTELPFNRETNLTVEFHYDKKYQEKVNLFVVNSSVPSEGNNNLKNEEQ